MARGRRGGSPSRGLGFRALTRAIGGASRYLVVLALAASLAAGTYFRVLPAINYGLELDANDPWIAYWLAEYFRENGLFSFEGLRRVDLFWYPYGRDFMEQEYIGVSWVAAATYPVGSALGLSLKEWISLFPPAAAALNVVLGFIAVYYITGSMLGGLVTAVLFAVSPGALSRTVAGFVEKTGVSVPLLSAYIIFLALALRGSGRRALAYAMLAGAFGGSISYFWGGYHLATVLLATLIALDPLFHRPSEARLKLYLAISATYALIVSSAPPEKAAYFLRDLGALVTGSMALYAAAFYLSRRGLYSWRIHLWALSVAGALGILGILSGFLEVGGRIRLAMGFRGFSPLVESVQEHAPMSLGDVVTQYGVPLVFVLGGLLVFAYNIYSGRRSRLDPLAATLYALVALLVYANINLAYFTQMASYIATIAAGVSAGLYMGLARRAWETDELRAIGAGAIIVVLLISSAYYASIDYSVNSVRAPQILTSGVGPIALGAGRTVVPLNDAWLRALEYIRENTSEDSVVVSWWDYGYWITVNTGRRTLADGATANETHIRLLARILTGTEDEASALMRLLGLEPGNTYLVFYDVYLGVFRRGPDGGGGVATLYPFTRESRVPGSNVYIINHGAQDLAKSFQMLRIGYRIDPFAPAPYLTGYSSEVVAQGTRIIHFPGFAGSPQENVTRVVQDTLLYRLSILGIAALSEAGIFTGACGFLGEASIFIPAVKATGGPAGTSLQPVIPLEEPRRFQPEAIIVGCPAGLIFDQGDSIEFYSVIVFIYKWTG